MIEWGFSQNSSLNEKTNGKVKSMKTENGFAFLLMTWVGELAITM